MMVLEERTLRAREDHHVVGVVSVVEPSVMEPSVDAVVIPGPGRARHERQSDQKRESKAKSFHTDALLTFTLRRNLTPEGTRRKRMARLRVRIRRRRSRGCGEPPQLRVTPAVGPPPFLCTGTGEPSAQPLSDFAIMVDAGFRDLNESTRRRCPFIWTLPRSLLLLGVRVRYFSAASSSSKLWTTMSGLGPRGSNGAPVRLIQHTVYPKLLAPTTSNEFEDTKSTSRR
jgi:hypothetical protein